MIKSLKKVAIGFIIGSVIGFLIILDWYNLTYDPAGIIWGGWFGAFCGCIVDLPGEETCCCECNKETGGKDDY